VRFIVYRRLVVDSQPKIAPISALPTHFIAVVVDEHRSSNFPPHLVGVKRTQSPLPNLRIPLAAISENVDFELMAIKSDTAQVTKSLRRVSSSDIRSRKFCRVVGWRFLPFIGSRDLDICCRLYVVFDPVSGDRRQVQPAGRLWWIGSAL
jgi:hypothetical protein